MTIRKNLFLLALAVALPVVLVLGALGWMLVAKERDTFDRGARDRVRSILTAVEAELRGSVSSLQAIAASDNLTRGDMRALHMELQRVLPSQHDWLNITLTDLSGQQLVNATQKWGMPLPRAQQMESLNQALRSMAPTVGPVSMGPVTASRGIAVRLPVTRNGKAAYVLTAVVEDQSFATLLQSQHLPPDWTVAIADQNRSFVARIPPMPAGSPVAQGFRAALESAPEGRFRALTLEGQDTYQWYATSPMGWAVGLAIPIADVEAGVGDAMLLTFISVLLALAAALIAAHFVGRRIERPILQLAAAADAIARGSAVRIEGMSGMREIAAVADSLRQAGETVREREAKLRTANRSKDEFLATLSHELRNPMASISMSPHILRKSSGQPEILAQVADMVERQSRLMTRLIDDLLDMSRITLGKLELAQRPLDLAEAVRSVADTWRTGGRLDKHEVDVHVESAWVNADPVRLEQVISNLLENSLKFTPPGGRISLAVRAGLHSAEFNVSDNGAGLPPGEAEHMFDVFVQGPQPLDRPLSGLGIGLALVRRVVELHGGRVQAGSPGVGQGMSCSVFLPRITPPAQEGAA